MIDMRLVLLVRTRVAVTVVAARAAVAAAVVTVVIAAAGDSTKATGAQQVFVARDSSPSTVVGIFFVEPVDEGADGRGGDQARPEWNVFFSRRMLHVCLCTDGS